MEGQVGAGAASDGMVNDKYIINGVEVPDGICICQDSESTTSFLLHTRGGNRAEIRKFLEELGENGVTLEFTGDIDYKGRCGGILIKTDPSPSRLEKIVEKVKKWYK